VEEGTTKPAETTDNDVPSCAVNTQQITTGAASCSDDSLMRHVEEGQRIAISVMCTNLHIAADDLLIEDVITHQEFMKVLTDVAVSVNKYFELSIQWKGHQSFVKKKSSISIKHSDVEKAIDSLKTELVELAGLRVVATNLALQLQSCQAKLSKMTLLLPVLFDVKCAIEGIIPDLQSCIRAQKQ